MLFLKSCFSSLRISVYSQLAIAHRKICCKCLMLLVWIEIVSTTDHHNMIQYHFLWSHIDRRWTISLTSDNSLESICYALPPLQLYNFSKQIVSLVCSSINKWMIKKINAKFNFKYNFLKKIMRKRNKKKNKTKIKIIFICSNFFF